MDRANAIRLLKALIAAGANSNTPMANPWIYYLNEVSLHGRALVSTLTYAGNEGWLIDDPCKDSTVLTRAGKVAAKLHG